MTAVEAQRGEGARADDRAGVRRVAMLTGAVTAAVAIGAAALASRPTVHPLPAYGALVVAALFAVAEIFPVHVRLRDDTHSLSFNELPLALGLLVLSPLAFVAAAAVGSGAALVAHRHQRGAKLAFNLAQIAFQAVVAATVFAVADGGASLSSVRTYTAAMAAMLAADMASAALVTAVIALYHGTAQTGTTLTMLERAFVYSLVKVALSVPAIYVVAQGDAFSLAVMAAYASCGGAFTRHTVPSLLQSR